MKRGSDKLIHIYCGDGKGKTTAAIGLAVRSAGCGKKVLFVQFFKNGVSSEINLLQKSNNIIVLFEPKYFGRVINMTDSEKLESRAAYMKLFAASVQQAEEDGADVIILDEIISAYNHGFVESEDLLSFLDRTKMEVVMTGRDPAKELCERANYITEMKKIKHPFDRGVMARKGIEF